MPKEIEHIDAKYAIKNSFGFGGKSAAIVLERP
jgi:3-oxoacyl-(acyl-carrier-protein) synthase